jgi:hypothetical protein
MQVELLKSHLHASVARTPTALQAQKPKHFPHNEEKSQ